MMNMRFVDHYAYLDRITISPESMVESIMPSFPARGSPHGSHPETFRSLERTP